MDKLRHQKNRQRTVVGDALAGKFEYDRADEKRKIQEEIEDFLVERQEKQSPSKG